MFTNFSIANPQMSDFSLTSNQVNNTRPSNHDPINEWKMSIPNHTSPDLANSLRTQKEYTIIGVGTPCLDIIYRVTSLFLQKYGLKPGDWHRMTQWDQFSTLLTDARSEHILLTSENPITRTGGSSSNTIKILASLKNSTAFFCKLGDHPSCDLFRTVMNKLNIDLLAEPSDDSITQIAVFITAEGQRTFVSYPSLSLDLSEDILLDKRPFQGVKLAHFEGYMLKEFSFDFLTACIKSAKESGAMVSFDLGSPFIAEEKSSEILSLLRNVDILFANESEVKALLPQHSIEESASFLTSPHYPSICVFFKGSEGALVCSRDHAPFLSPAHEAEAIDTNGAGDAFIAGFLDRYLKNSSLEECAWVGNLLGGTLVTVPGAEIPDSLWPSLLKQIEGGAG
ncbi:MAG: adenosine kinase [Parachlamydiaceae bacterium]